MLFPSTAGRRAGGRAHPCGSRGASQRPVPDDAGGHPSAARSPRRRRPPSPSPSATSARFEPSSRGCATRTRSRPPSTASYNGSFSAAIASEKRLRGTRQTELEAVVDNLHAIAASGQLTPSRLPVLFQTLDRNRQWWTTGPLLSSGQRVEFSGSKLVWEYYPGQGIELQVLGTFGKADGLYTAGAPSTRSWSRCWAR